MVNDPVCGMQVDEKSTQHVSNFSGASYYFCSAADKAKSELAAMPDRRRIAFHGRVRYRGTLKQKYATRFFWWYFPEEDQCVQCLTKKYNSHT